MKIRFLLHNAYGPGGGVLTVTLGLARDLSQRGHQVEIVSVLREHTRPARQVPPGVTLRWLVDLRPECEPTGAHGWLRRWALRRPSRLFAQVDRRHRRHSLYSDIQLVRYLLSVRDGVLVGMQPGVNVAIAQWGRRGCLRVVQEHRPFRSRPAVLRQAYQRFAPRLDAFLTLTPRDARRARKAFGGAVSVKAMPNGAPIFHGPPSDQRARVVVAAGRLQRNKGFDRLIHAWVKVADKHPDWQLRIFGDGGLRDVLQAQIEGSGLSGSVRLMGYTTRLQREMAAASVFVLSSRREGYGMVLLEAMSCGVPVVSFDCPTGPRNVIGEHPGGVLVDNNDVEGLADAVIGLIELGPEQRRELGAAARRRAHEQSRSAIAERWEALLSGG